MASRCLRAPYFRVIFNQNLNSTVPVLWGLIEGQSGCDGCEAEVHSELGGFFSLIRYTAAAEVVTRDIQVEADGLSQARTGGVR